VPLVCDNGTASTRAAFSSPAAEVVTAVLIGFDRIESERPTMRSVILTLALELVHGFVALAADVAPAKVDQIFSVYDKAGSPGCALGVRHDGPFIYRRAYGLASLELGVPLSTQSVFYMGSVSIG
jgi:CubicO group peptidase (beta-lactamase class C family)